MAERDQLSSPGACCASWAASSQKSPQPFSQGWSLCLHYSSLTNPVREFIAQWSQQCVVCSLTRRWSLLLSGLSMGAVCLTLCCCCFFQSFKSQCGCECSLCSGCRTHSRQSRWLCMPCVSGQTGKWFLFQTTQSLPAGLLSESLWPQL